MLKHYTLLALILVIGQLAWAQSGSHSLLDHTNIEISTTPINTQTSDIGPAIVGNELWFSAYTDRDVRNILAGRTDKRFYKTFAVPIDQEGNITLNERRLIADFNTEFHEGPVAYSERTGELFVTLSNTVNVEVEVDGLVVKRKKMRLRLVVAQLIDNLWKITHEMPFNDPVYSVGHPSVTQTGDTLFFTSDLAGQTIGKTDIYMVTRQNGQWGTPKNLGSTINTPGDEMFPYFHHTGALIFASNGHKGGKGGLDLYYSQLTPEGFTPVKAIEALNTPHDDFGLMINQQGNLGYFVSNKPGNTGDDDIYKIRISKKLMAINGLVTNVNTGTAIAQAKVQLSDCNNQVIKTVDSDEQGQFRFENLPMACYKITASKENYTTDTKTVTNDEQVNLQLKPSKELIANVLDYDTRTPIPHASLLINKKAFTVDNKAQLKMQLTNETKLEILASAEGYLNQTTNINVESDGIHHHNILLMKKEMNKTFVLENIYYDLDKWNLLPASEQELDKLVQIMKENPSIVIELGSHTDSRGSDAYNQTLSQRRSESAVSYIITKGIPRAKIIAKGYGESQLVNRCANGVACSDEEHRKNRRTEFKIIALD